MSHRVASLKCTEQNTLLNDAVLYCLKAVRLRQGVYENFKCYLLYKFLVREAVEFKSFSFWMNCIPPQSLLAIKCFYFHSNFFYRFLLAQPLLVYSNRAIFTCIVQAEIPTFAFLFDSLKLCVTKFAFGGYEKRARIYSCITGLGTRLVFAGRTTSFAADLDSYLHSKNNHS